MMYFLVEEAKHLKCGHLAFTFRHVGVGEREQYHQRKPARERHDQRDHRAHQVEFEAFRHMRAAHGFHDRVVVFQLFRVCGLGFA